MASTTPVYRITIRIEEPPTSQLVAASFIAPSVFEKARD